jgi:CRISPR-associated protein Cas1
MNIRTNPLVTAGAAAERALPDYLPARMVNEFVYCPRLFFYEWVEGLFRESADTVEGKIQHERVDGKATALPTAEQTTQETFQSRSALLSSERLRVIARMDLIEGFQGKVTPVDYKHGAPRETEGGIEAWPTDRIQLAVQALILREHGYNTEEGFVYYAKTRQRICVPFDPVLLQEAEQVIAGAWKLAQSGQIPPPLVDSPKCPACSLVTICLPDETNALCIPSSVSHRPARQLSLFSDKLQSDNTEQAQPRQLITPRDDLRPLYINSQGTHVGKSGGVLKIRTRDKQKIEVRINEICQLNLFGHIQLTAQVIQGLCAADIPICYFSQGSWFYGITRGLNTKNVFLRRTQFRLADQEWFSLALARRLIAGKIRNQRTLLQRNHREPSATVLAALKRMAELAEQASSSEELLGIEGNAARLYFEAFAGMIKVEEPDTASSFNFDFAGRNRRPPRDPVNALLSLAYSLLVKDLTIACYAVGFDPYEGFFHQPRFGRPALALDLMEPFRPLIADSAVLIAVNTRMITPKDFIRVGPAVALTPAGRKAFFRAYELRMDTLVTHPMFSYRVSYRRVLEIQARLLARLLQGEIPKYPVFVTR